MSRVLFLKTAFEFGHIRDRRFNVKMRLGKREVQEERVRVVALDEIDAAVGEEGSGESTARFERTAVPEISWEMLPGMTRVSEAVEFIEPMIERVKVIGLTGPRLPVMPLAEERGRVAELL